MKPAPSIRKPETGPATQGAKQRLLEAALTLFNEKGYAATSVREIVDKAGVTKPVLYYYFKNKEELYIELLRIPFERLDHMLSAIRSTGGSARRRIEGLLDHMLALFIDNLREARLMYSIYYGPPQGAPFFDFESTHLSLASVTRELVVEGIDSGEFACDPDTTTWLLIGAANYVMEEQLCHREPLIHRDGLRRMIGQIFQGITPHPNKKKR